MPSGDMDATLSCIAQQKQMLPLAEVLADCRSTQEKTELNPWLVFITYRKGSFFIPLPLPVIDMIVGNCINEAY